MGGCRLHERCSVPRLAAETRPLVHALCLFGALTCTAPATMPGDTLCLGTPSSFPEEPIFRWLIRRRPAYQSAWYDTIRWAPQAGEVPGGAVRLPLLMPRNGFWFFQVSAMDSAGNAKCWSNLAWRAR